MTLQSRRAANGGAAAVSRNRFKAPLDQPRREVDIAAVVPGDVAKLCIWRRDGSFTSMDLPPISSMRNAPTGADAAELIVAELRFRTFESGIIACEWPLPKQAEVYAAPACMARDGTVLASRTLKLDYCELSQTDVARAFGAEGASRTAIEAAIRDAGLGYEGATNYNKSIMAIAWALVAGLASTPAALRSAAESSHPRAKEPAPTVIEAGQFYRCET